MPSYLIKPDRDVDFYVSWSEVVDNMGVAGTRGELQDFDPHEFSDERFDRADLTGTSANWPGYEGRQIYRYDDPGPLIVGNEHELDYTAGAWLLPRAKLREFCDRKGAGLPVRDLLDLESHED